MDGKAVLFERVLCEFNWGQQSAENQLQRPEDFQLTADQVATTNNLNRCISRYINWANGMAQLDLKNKTTTFTTPAYLQRRNELVNAIYKKLSDDRPCHTALVVLANDMRLASTKTKQDCICLQPDSGKAKNSIYVRVNTKTFLTKTGLPV